MDAQRGVFATRSVTHLALLVVLVAAGFASTGGCRTTPGASGRGSPKGRAVLVRGLMDVFSLGMNEIAETLAERGFEATAISGALRVEEGRRLIEQAEAGELPRPLVIAGHSYGGDDAVRLTRQLERAGVTVDKLILIDATTPPPVPGNVRKVFNIYKSSPGTDWVPALRGVPINDRRRASDLPATRVLNLDLRKADDPALRKVTINHFNIDASSRVQELVVEHALAAREDEADKPWEAGESPYRLLLPREETRGEQTPAASR